MKKLKLLIAIFCICLLIQSCNKIDNKNELSLIKITSVESDTLFSIKDKQFTFFTMFGNTSLIDIVEFNKTNYIYLKPLNIDTLYRFVIGEGIIKEKCYTLNKDCFKTENGIISGLKVINQDSIVFLQDSLISIYCISQNKIINQIIKRDNNFSIFNQFSLMKWDNKTSSLYTELIHWDAEKDKRGILKTPRISKISFEDNNISSVPIYHHKKSDEMKFNNGIYFCLANNCILLGFGDIPNTTIYNLKNGKITETMLRSGVDTFLLNPNNKNTSENEMDFDEMKSSFFQTFKYNYIASDEENQLIFKSYLIPNQNKCNSGLKTTFCQPQYGIAVFDFNFKYVGDILPKFTGIPRYIFSFNNKLIVVLQSKRYLCFQTITYEIPTKKK